MAKTVVFDQGQQPAEGDLRVWHIPQVPGEAFHVLVNRITEAKVVLAVLAQYDAFQLQHNIKPDYSNAAGLEEFVGGEWEEWMHPETGDDIDEIDFEEAAEFDVWSEIRSMRKALVRGELPED